jgi:hypothetical protein
VMAFLETGAPEQALSHIESALASRRIYRVHADKLRTIVQALSPSNL